MLCACCLTLLDNVGDVQTVPTKDGEIFFPRSRELARNKRQEGDRSRSFMLTTQVSYFTCLPEECLWSGHTLQKFVGRWLRGHPGGEESDGPIRVLWQTHQGTNWLVFGWGLGLGTSDFCGPPAFPSAGLPKTCCVLRRYYRHHPCLCQSQKRLHRALPCWDPCFRRTGNGFAMQHNQ